MTPKNSNGPRFLYIAPTRKFHHSMFTRLEVVVLTNKHTDAAENIQRSVLRRRVISAVK